MRKAKDYLFRVWRPYLTENNMTKILVLEEMSPLQSRDIVMQWTGLLDKNGKKIFEGDICIGMKAGGLNYKEQRVSVEYCNASFCETYFGNPLSADGDFRDLEVIGNIYENPELLKEQP